MKKQQVARMVAAINAISLTVLRGGKRRGAAENAQISAAHDIKRAIHAFHVRLARAELAASMASVIGGVIQSAHFSFEQTAVWGDDGRSVNTCEALIRLYGSDGELLNNFDDLFDDDKVPSFKANTGFTCISDWQDDLTQNVGRATEYANIVEFKVSSAGATPLFETGDVDAFLTSCQTTRP